MATKKIIITDNLKEVLNKIDNKTSHLILSGEIDVDLLSNPEKNFNYIDLSHTTKGHLSYLTQDKIERIENEGKDYWDVKMRYHSRPGSFIKKLLKIDDQDLSNFITQFLSIVDPPIYTMELVKGKDISKYYNVQNYVDQNGSLGGSCMKSSPDEFFDIYTQNPNQIGMLVMLNQHGKLMGRAIVWLDLNLMDRIYVSNDNHVNFFHNWANENNYLYKEFNNWNTPKNWVNQGIKEIKEFELTLDEVNFDKYPYIDSFKWLDLSTKKIYNYIPKNCENLIVVSDYNGHYYEHDYFNFCDVSNRTYVSSDIVYLDYFGKNVYSGLLVFSNILNEHILLNHSKYMGDINDSIFNEEYDKYNDWKLINLKKKHQSR